MSNFITSSLRELKSYRELLEGINEKHSPLLISGNLRENLGHIIYGLNTHTKKQIMLITYEEKRARDIREDIENLGGNAFLFPRKEYIFYDIDAYDNIEDDNRLKAMFKLSRGDQEIIVTSVETIFDKIISKENFQKLTKKIQVGDTIDLKSIGEVFVYSGYERVSTVEAIGQFSIRGGILDYFPSNEENPIRVEFFDDEVDSIRSFDGRTQRSIEKLDKSYIIPVKETLILNNYRDEIVSKIGEDLDAYLASKSLENEDKTKVKDKFLNIADNIKENVYLANRDIITPYIPEEFQNSIIDYLSEDAILFIDEPRRVEERIKIHRDGYLENYKYMYEVGELLNSHTNMYYGEDKFIGALDKHQYVENVALLTITGRDYKKTIKFLVKEGQNYHKKMDLLREELNRFKDLKYRVLLLSGTRNRGLRLMEDLNQEGFNTTYLDDLSVDMKFGDIFITSGSIQGGFEYPENRFVIINDEDIFGAGRRVKRKRKKDPKKQLSFTDLKLGDYVVHENHGIGRYEGIERLEIQGNHKDYLNIRYREGDKLYVPIDQMHLIQKYIGSDKSAPKINKLSSAEWAKTKERAKLAVEDMAEDLLKLYATRKEVSGYGFSPDGKLQRDFEDYFPYEETEGQLRATEEIKLDMESKKPMDRLLCGDVGYGKTEVALRAAFKAIVDGKQVAFLVPTTILAQQHYKTICERFEKFPVEIGILSRFKTAAEQKDTLEKLAKGRLDIVIGTHRLLSEDVKFKDLGLLIVDEEQRFGVKHKERLKRIKSNVDVLTLTATPIPRTLHMSLSGIRDMSVLDEPPEERYPIQTYVAEYNAQIIRDAILKELGRGGQVYFVYNRVKTINKMAKELSDLVPEARFAVGHGQLSEKSLENVMMDFYEGESDVLVCTTIIETGMDFPNVNTIIIDNSDWLGLSQLYQLRGRVGRSNRLAYAYFLYEEDKVLSEVAERRLLAIKEFTEFGSGFKVAMRDLEIRGAGNLLGAQQHGQIEAIGYDLYVKFLNEAIKKLKGEEFKEPVDTIIDLEMDAYIPNKYIRNSATKVEIYKQVANLSTREECQDVIDELIDRFGDFPKEVKNLIDISYIRGLGSKNNVKNIIQNGKKVNIEFDNIDEISPEFIGDLTSGYGPRILFNLGKKPGFSFRTRKNPLKELIGIFEFIDSLGEKSGK